MDPDERGLNETRGYACEIVAWRFLTSLPQSELIDYLLYELPSNTAKPNHKRHDPLHRVHFDHDGGDDSEDDQSTRSNSLLLDRECTGNDSTSHNIQDPLGAPHNLSRNALSRLEEDLTSPFVGLNALEIAAVADAKGFLSQRVVQKIVNGIWCGDIMFWDSLNVRTKKKAQRYNKKKADPYSRLRVPQYQKVFEALFFASFLALYYAVLVERNPRHITVTEVLLYLWIASFAYEEFGEFTDAGTLFYAADFWSLWDLAIIGVGAAFLISSRYSPTLIESFIVAICTSFLANTRYSIAPS